MRTDLDFLAERYPAKVYDYRDYIRSKAGEPVGKGRVWPGVMPAWDNCARSPKAGHVFHGSTPRLFYEWLKSSIDRARANPAEERFVVINAWNEWAEGAYLEPDRRSGYGYLTACASAISDQGAADAAAAAIFRSSREAFRAGKRLASCAHLYDSSAAESLRDDLRSFDDLDLYLTVPRHTPPDAAQRLLDLFPRAFIQEVENRGRDVLPFLRVLHAARRGNHDFICKMHAGGSFHNGTAELAADETLRSLLSERLRRQLQAAAKSNRVGVVVPKGSPASRSAGESVPRISQYTANLMAELKLTAAPDGGLASPSMFWFRPAAISKLVDAVDLDQFEPELGQTEGTLALGLQRMWIAAAQSAAFEVQQAAA